MMKEHQQYIYSLNALSKTHVAIAGGKGANLGEPTRASLPVPPGFVISTDGYHDFVTVNHIQTPLLDAIASVGANDVAGQETASQTIHDLFMAGQIPDALQTAIKQAYQHHKTQ